MAQIVEVTMEFVTPEDGRQYFRVRARHGNTGENPKRSVLFDGTHYPDALNRITKALASARKGHMEAITAAYDHNKQDATVELQEA